MQRASGFVEKGVTTLSINGVTTAASVQRAYPGATVAVYGAGTLVLSTIYSDNSATAKANPFTASADGSWFFYAADGRYDVKFSGGGIATPWTLADILLDDATTGASAVMSVFGRTGAISAQASDYTFAQLGGTAVVGQLPAAGGDLSGTLTNATVAKLQGRAMAATAPTSGQAIIWVAGSSTWAPGTPAVATDHAGLSNLGVESAGHTGYATISGTETLTNKTLATPTIASFANAVHTHADTAGGGYIAATTISGVVTVAKGGTAISGYTKGDLLAGATGAGLARLGVGTDGQVLMADAAATYGLKWAPPGGTHNLLSGTHADTVSGVVTRGSIIVGGASTWGKLATGTNGKVLKTDGIDPAWGSAGLSATATLAIATAVPQGHADLTIGVTGAVIGNPVALGLPVVPPAGTCFSAFVSDTATVTVRFNNYSAVTATADTGSYTAMVFK